MLSFLIALAFSLWFLFACSLFNRNGESGEHKTKGRIKSQILKSMKLEDYRHEAESIGWKINTGELAIIVIVAMFLVLLISIITSNPFVLLAGFTVGFYLPKFLIEKKRRSIRLNMICRLTDPMRMLLSRIPVQQNVTKAIEYTRDETPDETIKSLFDAYLQDVSIGGSVRDALLNMKRRVRLRKFDVFVENLIQANYEGFTPEAIKALDKSVEAIEFDLRAIEKVKVQSITRKRNLLISLGTIWIFPPILSMVNTGHNNIYLNTFPGKILILLYVIGSLYVYVKGEEYLSLNLDEL